MYVRRILEGDEAGKGMTSFGGGEAGIDADFVLLRAGDEQLRLSVTQSGRARRAVEDELEVGQALVAVGGFSFFGDGGGENSPSWRRFRRFPEDVRTLVDGRIFEVSGNDDRGVSSESPSCSS